MRKNADGLKIKCWNNFFLMKRNHTQVTFELYPCQGQTDLDCNEEWMLVHQVSQAVLVGDMVLECVEKNLTLHMASIQRFSSDKNKPVEHLPFTII